MQVRPGDFDLMVGLVFKLLQSLFQRLSASRRYEVGGVVDAPAQRRDIEREGNAGVSQDNKRRDDEEP